MQDRALASLRLCSRARAGTLALVLGTAVAAGACTQDGPLSDEEMAQLRAFTLPAGPPVDTSNAFADDPAAARLGKQLYYDGRYSGALLAPYNGAVGVNGALGVPGDAGKVSCAVCHDPATGGADRRSQPNATSLGTGYTVRNAPTSINAAYSPHWQFWDGRVDSLWSQALSPPEGAMECNSSRLKVVHFLYDHYRAPFEAVFGAGSLPASVAGLPPDGTPGNDPTCAAGDPKEPYGDAFDCLADTDKQIVNRAYVGFGKAIAAYERRLISNAFDPSPFDRFMAGDAEAISPAAIRGARLFVGHAGCMECHRGETFTDFDFHNIGAPQTGEYASPTDSGRYDGIGMLTSANNIFSRAGGFSDDTSDTAYLGLLTGPPPNDVRGQFKTPSLRNVAKTAPYMHDGVYQTLWDVVNHYNFGGTTGQYEGARDPAVAPLMLTAAELGDLVEFLRALDDGAPLPSTDFPEGLLAPPALAP